MTTLLSALLLCLPIALVLALGPQEPVSPQPEPGQPTIAVGKPAPAFRLNDETGALTEFGGAARTWTVLAFYPKAMTGG